MHAWLGALLVALVAAKAHAGDAPAAPHVWAHGSVAPAGTLFQPGAGAGPGLAFYRLPEFEGASLILRESEPDIARFGLGTRARSVRVSGRWLLCSEPEFAGRCVEVSSSQPRLAWSHRLTQLGSASYLGRAGEALEMR